MSNKNLLANSSSTQSNTNNPDILYFTIDKNNQMLNE